MVKESKESKQVVGCFLAIWQLLIVNPLWLVLLFALMLGGEMPVWAWVCYWIYVPACVLGVILAAYARWVMDS